MAVLTENRLTDITNKNKKYGKICNITRINEPKQLTQNIQNIESYTDCVAARGSWLENATAPTLGLTLSQHFNKAVTSERIRPSVVEFGWINIIRIWIKWNQFAADRIKHKLEQKRLVCT